jgi:SAM-dependent methyltransferase
VNATTEQYRDPRRLGARITLHERFSANPVPWMRWVFDQFAIPAGSRVLEIGSGTGNLWSENAGRIDPSWRLTLADFSADMLGKARATLAEVRVGGAPFRADYAVADVDALPGDFGPFDVVIANHMLYHARDVRGAIAGLRRVLAPGGTLYASTNGWTHLAEIDDWIVDFHGGEGPVTAVTRVFNLQNGEGLLRTAFEHVERREYPDHLLVDDVDALAGYCFSLTYAGLPADRHDAFRAALAERMQSAGGALHIRKESGMFVVR